MLQEDHAQIPQPLIDVRVVDDLAGQEDLALRELAPGLIGVIDRALDAVAEAELAREPNGDVAGRERVVALLEEIDEPPVIGSRELALDLVLEAESLPEIRRVARRLRGRIRHAGI